jgi:hypothetical protein
MKFIPMLPSIDADLFWPFNILLFVSGLGSKLYEITTVSHDVIVIMSMSIFKRLEFIVVFLSLTVWCELMSCR